MSVFKLKSLYTSDAHNAHTKGEKKYTKRKRPKRSVRPRYLQRGRREKMQMEKRDKDKAPTNKQRGKSKATAAATNGTSMFLEHQNRATCAWICVHKLGVKLHSNMHFVL